MSNNTTKIYIMIDKNTGYYKIGRSINPNFREKTLQSEKPTIELLYTFDALCKDEKKLHNMFISQRIRGEWFKLSDSDIDIVKDFFKNKVKIPEFLNNIKIPKKKTTQLIDKLVWEIPGTNYQFNKEGKCLNIKTNKEVKMILNGRSKGFCLNGKFQSLSKIRPQLKKIIS